MSKDPLMNAGSGLESLLKKLTGDQELDAVILQEKVDLLARVAVDHLYDDACGNVVSHKASALLGLAAHRDYRCRKLILAYLKNYNLTLKRSALLAAKVLGDKSLIKAIAVLLTDKLAIIRMQAMDCLVTLAGIDVEDYLIPLINDPVWYVREKLARSLGEVRAGEGILHLLEKDDKTAVRLAAETALVHA